MTTKQANLDDALAALQWAERRHREAREDYDKQRIAFIVEHWDCRPGMGVRHTRTGKLGVVESVDLRSAYGHANLTTERPWLMVQPIKTDGKPMNRISQWFSDWVLA